MRVLIQRSEDGLFWKSDGVWTAGKEDAKDFKNCNPAIDFCVEHRLQDVRLFVSFDDPKYDFPMEVFRAETRVLVRHDRELTERGRPLPAAMVQEQAKDGKKPFPLARKPVSDDPAKSGR